MIIAGIIVYTLIGLVCGFLSIFIWGAMNVWAGFKSPDWLGWLLVILTVPLWPLYLTFCILWVKYKGPFRTNWLT